MRARTRTLTPSGLVVLDHPARIANTPRRADVITRIRRRDPQPAVRNPRSPGAAASATSIRRMRTDTEVDDRKWKTEKEMQSSRGLPKVRLANLTPRGR